MATIIDYFIKRLAELGISEIFGVPGDYNFKILEAIEECRDTKWIGCCNELNAGYAADGYARIKGMGAVVTTYGVGELSAINAAAGSYAENLPVVCIAGLPKKELVNQGKIFHHCLNSNYKIFEKIYSNVTAFSVVLSEENAQEEIETALSIAYHQKKPVYIGIYDDICKKKIKLTQEKFKEKKSNIKNLKDSAVHISDILDKAKNPVIISEFPVLRLGLKEEMQNLVEKSGFASTTMMMGKGSIDETSANFIGTYAGNLISDETAKIVEKSDCVLGFGILMSDFNTGGYSSKLDLSKVISIQYDTVIVENKVYKDVLMKDVIKELTEEVIPKKQDSRQIPFEYKYAQGSDKELGQKFIYIFMQNYLQEGDIYLAETGLTSIGSVPIRLPKDASFCIQAFWGSIGWATPACLGACFAAKDKRPILITGEGSHQMTFQEISTMLRYGLKPIIVVLNNSGYTIERLLSKNPMDKFNDIAVWDYTQVVKGFWGNKKTYKVRTEREFEAALKDARKIDELVYIEAFTERLDAPAVVKKLTDKLGS